MNRQRLYQNPIQPLFIPVPAIAPSPPLKAIAPKFQIPRSKFQEHGERRSVRKRGRTTRVEQVTHAFGIWNLSFGICLAFRIYSFEFPPLSLCSKEQVAKPDRSNDPYKVCQQHGTNSVTSVLNRDSPEVYRHYIEGSI